jgi:F0F1-type ATP synthase membrane subunit b/b'
MKENEIPPELTDSLLQGARASSYLSSVHVINALYAAGAITEEQTKKAQEYLEQQHEHLEQQVAAHKKAFLGE